MYPLKTTMNVWPVLGSRKRNSDFAQGLKVQQNLRNRVLSCALLRTWHIRTRRRLLALSLVSGCSSLILRDGRQRPVSSSIVRAVDKTGFC